MDPFRSCASIDFKAGCETLKPLFPTGPNRASLGIRPIPFVEQAMKPVSLLIVFLFCSQLLCAQALKTIKVHLPAPQKTKEVFQVLKENPDIKFGRYEKYKYKHLIEKGYYKNNQRDSIWSIYSQAGQQVATGYYKADSLVGIWSYFSSKGKLVQRYDYDKDSLLYFDVEEERKFGQAPFVYPDTARDQLPIFIGGRAYMIATLENNIQYPEEAWKQKKTAKVIVRFVVDEVGNTTQVKVDQKVGDGFDEEAIRTIQLFGKGWIPGSQSGRKVKVSFQLPVRFFFK